MAVYQGVNLYKDRASILASFISAFQAAIPDVWVDEDGNLRILLEIESAQIEGLYVANQILFENLFIQYADYTALQLRGEELGLTQKTGTFSTGLLLFSGQGGTFIGTGAEVAYDPGNGSDILYFTTTQDATIPNPGTPSAPSAADAGGGGSPVIPAGTYEYVVTFLTASGETLPSDPSNAVTLTALGSINVTVPLGGPGTTIRKLYRAVDGGEFFQVATINDNTTTTFFDDSETVGVTQPPTVSTAEAILISAQSEEPGVGFNAVPGAITVLSAVPPGVTGVTNPTAFTNGSDPEGIDDYRNRLLTFIRAPSTGSPDDLIGWAEEIEGVESATIFPNDNLGTPTPGHVTVRIYGPDGAIPPTPVINNVADNIASKDLANIIVHVGTFTPQPIDTSVSVTVATGFLLSEITANIQQAIVNYINAVPVGGTVYVAGIIAAVMAVAGVADVDVTEPTSNQTVPTTAKFVANTPTVS